MSNFSLLVNKDIRDFHLFLLIPKFWNIFFHSAFVIISQINQVLLSYKKNELKIDGEITGRLPILYCVKTYCICSL